jgi:hypothetical protein
MPASEEDRSGSKHSSPSTIRKKSSPATPKQSPSTKSHRTRSSYHRGKHVHDTVLETATAEAVRLPRKVSWSSFDDHNGIVAFYNLYIGKPEHYPSIVEEQLELMNMTGLLRKLDVVYYVTIGASSDNIPLNVQNMLHSKKEGSNHPMFVEVRNSVKEVDETLTLSYLYDFCAEYPKSKVLYFHDKGSYNYRGENVFFRHFLDCYVLNPECIAALEEGFDVCGLRISPMPTLHYSGNYWWARCDYVNKLVHPGSMALNQSFSAVTKTLSSNILSNARYFAETWVSSHPKVNPADCMSHEVDTTFFCCYDLAEISPKECPNHAKHFIANKNDMDGVKYTELRQKLKVNILASMKENNGTLKIGSKCKASGAFVHGDVFGTLYRQKRNDFERGFNIIDELTKRSMLWYGEEPISFLKAIDRLENYANASSYYNYTQA